MPIYRCSQCSFVSEESTSPVGSKLACARCGNECAVYGTVFYVEKLIERYFSALREIKSLQEADNPADRVSAVGNALTSAPVASTAPPASAPLQSLSGVEMHSTTKLATAEQHAPLKAWFAAHQIEAQFDYALVDTSGFFDDAARMIGEGYALFAELMDRVRYAYRQSHSSVNLELANLSQNDIKAITTLCRQLYSHTFFARYHYQKPEKIMRLTLQTAPVVRQFFDGGWLEWYAFIEQISQLAEKRLAFSCARGVNVVFPNEDLHELDVVCLPNGQAPIVIECKSGEFRRDIDKYLRLRKRLGLNRSRFIICAADLSLEQAQGLTAMYELTFVNLETLAPHLAQLT